MDLAKRIKRARAASGISQVELARKLAVAPSTVAGWELGLHAVRHERLHALARALGVSVVELIK